MHHGDEEPAPLRIPFHRMLVDCPIAFFPTPTTLFPAPLPPPHFFFPFVGAGDSFALGGSGSPLSSSTMIPPRGFRGVGAGGGAAGSSGASGSRSSGWSASGSVGPWASCGASPAPEGAKRAVRESAERAARGRARGKAVS